MSRAGVRRELGSGQAWRPFASGAADAMQTTASPRELNVPIAPPVDRDRVGGEAAVALQQERRRGGDARRPVGADCRLRPHWPGVERGLVRRPRGRAAPGSSERGGRGARRDERPRAPVLTGTERATAARAGGGTSRARLQSIGTRYRAATLTRAFVPAPRSIVAPWSCSSARRHWRRSPRPATPRRAAPGPGGARLRRARDRQDRARHPLPRRASTPAPGCCSARATTSRSRAPLGPIRDLAGSVSPALERRSPAARRRTRSRRCSWPSSS